MYQSPHFYDQRIPEIPRWWRNTLRPCFVVDSADTLPGYPGTGYRRRACWRSLRPAFPVGLECPSLPVAGVGAPRAHCGKPPCPFPRALRNRGDKSLRGVFTVYKREQPPLSRPRFPPLYPIGLHTVSSPYQFRPLRRRYNMITPGPRTPPPAASGARDGSEPWALRQRGSEAEG